MREEASWLDELDDADETDGRRRRFMVLAAIPWVLVVALLLIATRSNGDTDGGHTPAEPASDDAADVDERGDDTTATQADREPPGATTAPEAPRTDGHGRDTPLPSPDGPAPPLDPAGGDLEVTRLGGTGGIELPAGTWRQRPGTEEAIALSVIVARAWLTDVAPVLEIDGMPPAVAGGYAEHIVVEAVEQPSREAIVVTLLAVLLTGGDELAADVTRLAVPIAMTADGPRPAGTPWSLPAPVLEPWLPDSVPLGGPEELEAAQAALDAAGLDDLEATALGRTTGWPVVAEAVDVAGESHTIWLRRHLDAFVVAGTPVSSTIATGSPR